MAEPATPPAAPPADPSAAPRRRRRRRRRPTAEGGPPPAAPAAAPPARPPSRPELARAALDALDALARELLAERGLSPTLPEEGPWLTLPVPVFAASAAERERQAAGLVSELTERIGAAATAAAAFVRGRVYCFRCAQAGCEHGAPPSPLHVFARYGATGEPQWQDFPNLCIEWGEPRADRLWATPPEVLALYVPGVELRRKVLAAFGRHEDGYRLLGQVCVGLVPGALVGVTVPRVALTLQLVGTRGGRGMPRLRLNVLGTAPEAIGDAASEAGPRSPAERLRRTLKETAARVDALGRDIGGAERRGEGVDLDALAEPLLLRLRVDLERLFRGVGRPDEGRTKHASAHHQETARPTANAWRDAREAPDERLRYDARSDTLVVLGPRGRAHVFSADGRHVTSLKLEPGEVDRKASRMRWRPVTPEQARTFRAHLAEGPPEA